MPQYTVEITETLQKQITIDASSKVEAYIMAKLMYKNSEIVLDAENHVDTKIDVYDKIQTKSRRDKER